MTGTAKVWTLVRSLFFTVVPVEMLLYSKSLYTSPVNQRKYINAFHVLINVSIVQFSARTPVHSQTTVEGK